MTDRSGSEHPHDRPPDEHVEHDAQDDVEHDDVRRLLAGLKDPAPMPPDLVRRITASLAEEQARRERDPHLATVHALDTARQRRPWARRLPAVAVAAAAVVLAGAGVMGVLNRGLSVGSGQDSVAGSEMLTATQMAESAEAPSLEMGRDSAEDAAEDTSGGAADGALESAGGAPGEDQSHSDDESLTLAADDAVPAAAGPAISASGTLVTSVTLRDFVIELRHRAPLTEDETAWKALVTSTVATPTDAAACLSGLLPDPVDDLTARVDAIDTVEFTGELRALIVLTDAPADVSEPQDPATAYLVPLDCERESATLLHEPVRVA